MNMNTLRIPLLAAAAATLAACSTPPAALDQANHTVTLTEQLRSELARYERNSALSVQRRSTSLARSAAVVRTVALETAVLDGHRAAAGGNEAAIAFEARLRQLVELRRAALAADDQARAQLQASLDALAVDLPKPDDRLAAVQKAMAALGTELSAHERAQLAIGFAKAVKAQVDQARAQAEQAASSEPPAPSPAPSATASSPEGQS